MIPFNTITSWSVLKQYLVKNLNIISSFYSWKNTVGFHEAVFVHTANRVFKGSFRGCKQFQ
jgi:hypothetical protein